MNPEIKSNNEGPIESTIKMFQKEIGLLATEDVATVGRNIKSAIEKKMEENPYETIATALGIGFGLSSLKLQHVKVAAMQVGKLMAMRSLANLEVSTNQQGESHEKH